MPDNLTVTIGIDTAKLRADAAIAKEELRKVNVAVKEAAKAGDVAGVQAGAAAQDALARQIAATNQQIRASTVVKQQNTVATHENTVATAESAVANRELGVEFGHLAHAAGLPVEGMRALRYGFLALAAVEVIRAFNDIAAKITELGRLSKESGFDPKLIQQWTVAVERAGGTAADAAASIRKLGTILTEAQAKASYTRFGAQWEDDALKRLNIDINQFKPGAEGAAQLLQRIARELVALNEAGRVPEATLASVQLLGKSYKELEEAIKLAASGDLSKLQAPVSAKDIARIEEYNKSIVELKHAWDEFATELATVVVPPLKLVLGILQGVLITAKEVATALGLIEQTDFGGGGDPAASRANDPWFGWDLSKAARPAMASGGYVSGPGSGTSDSIAARLSNGEFVLNAGSVRRLGVGFLQGLNSFAGGGLVGAVPRFASGGMVATAGGGATVNLHFPGGSFALTADNAIVGGLTREARRAGMLTAGRPAGVLG